MPQFLQANETVNGVSLHYRLGGPEGGRPVILWHGFLSTGNVWRKVAPDLARAGYRVLIPDMRGYGDSDKPEGTAGYDARSLMEETRALTAAIGFGRNLPLLLAAHDMGGLPALIWAADHANEIAALAYIEAPVMLAAALKAAFTFDRAHMAEGSMWWWLLPLAPDVPERLIVGNERAFLTWFHRHMAHPEAIEPAALNEVLRTFHGTEGVLGAMGLYRAAFDSIDQTEPLIANKITTPVLAIGGRKGLGDKVGQMMAQVATIVTAVTLEDSGHFVPEEQPAETVRHLMALADRTMNEGVQT
ncbi:MAG: alpha/beta fold hydrolase [Rhodobacterales bacterium]|nr:alpha/beta hydrolase [Puniceibacterium antarcticum]